MSGVWPGAGVAFCVFFLASVCWAFRRLKDQVTQLTFQLKQKSLEVETLKEVSQAIVKVDHNSPSLAAIVSIVARALQADLVAFMIVDDESGELVTQPGAFGLNDDELLYRVPLKDERSSSVRVFKSRLPFVTGDAQNDPGVITSYTRAWNIHSLIVVPLIVEEKVLGVVRIGKKERQSFSQEEVSLATVVAKEASILVETDMLNRRLAQTAEQLETLNRMKDEFVSTVSHEFKTPLTTISGFLSVMLDGEVGPINEQQMKFLQITKAATKRLSGLVSDLLDLSRLEGGIKMDLRVLDLVELINTSVTNHLPMAVEGGRTLSFNFPGKSMKVQADQRWFGMVIDNLLSNALKFTSRGGHVQLQAIEKGEFIMVSVIDDGIGIPKEDGPKIFDRFFRASNRSAVNAPGTGLGLAIAREVVLKHGGKIWFESAGVGKGSSFHFVIPTYRTLPSDL